MGPNELLKEIFLGWDGRRVSRVSRVSMVAFSCPRPPRLDMARVARAGDEIKVEIPKKRQIVQTIIPGSCTAVTGCMEEVETPALCSNLRGPCLGGWKTVRGHC